MSSIDGANFSKSDLSISELNTNFFCCQYLCNICHPKNHCRNFFYLDNDSVLLIPNLCNLYLNMLRNQLEISTSLDSVSIWKSLKIVLFTIANNTSWTVRIILLQAPPICGIDGGFWTLDLPLHLLLSKLINILDVV